MLRLYIINLLYVDKNLFSLERTQKDYSVLNEQYTIQEMDVIFWGLVIKAINNKIGVDKKDYLVLIIDS